MTLNLDELRNALAECLDVEEDDVRALLESEDRDARLSQRWRWHEPRFARRS